MRGVVRKIAAIVADDPAVRPAAVVSALRAAFGAR
jgi:hypothetical protein